MWTGAWLGLGLLLGLLLGPALTEFEAAFVELGVDLPLPTVALIVVADLLWHHGPTGLLAASTVLASTDLLDEPVFAPVGVALFGGAMGFIVIALFMPLITLIEPLA